MDQSWRLEGRLENLKEVLDSGISYHFNHVRILKNKVAGRLENLKTETCRVVKAKDWGEMMDVTTRDRCINLTYQDM